MIGQFVSKIHKYNRYIFFLILLTIFILPSQSSLFLSGIPITNKYSTIISILLISFFIFNFYIFDNYILKIFLFCILLIKITILFLPNTGVELKQYFNENDLKNNNFIRSYDSFWNNETSFIQQRNFNTKANFPIDWTVHSKINLKKNQKKHFNSYEEYIQLNLIYNLSFYLYLSKNETFKIKSAGSNFDNLFINNMTNNEVDKLLINTDFNLKKGLYKIHGDINFNDDNWSLQYLIKNKQGYSSAFLDNKIYLTNNDTSNINKNYFFIKSFSTLLDLSAIILCILIFLIFANFFKLNFNKYVLIIMTSTFLIFFLLKNFTSSFDLYGSFPVAVSYLFSFLLIFLFKKNIEINQANIHTIFFLIVFPLLCFFYVVKFYSEIESVTWWDYGDDWTAFQTFARAIVVDNEWLNAGEGVIYFRPGIRYIFAFIHIVYGFSGFAQKIIEPILIFAGCYLFIFIFYKFKINPLITLFSSILLISIFLGENYRWNISRGITEYYSFFFILLNIYLFLYYDYKKIINFVFISMIGIINVWLREDHITLIFLAIYISMINDTYYHKLNFFNSVYQFTLKNSIYIFLYGAFLSGGLFLLWFRNYYVGGNLGLDHPYLAITSDTHIRSFELDIFSNLYMLFTASILPNPPRVTSLFLFGAFIIALFKILNLSKFRCIHPSLILLMFGCFIPAFIAPLIGYYPRYTIKYLPLCILVFALYFNSNNFFTKTKFKKS